MTMHGGVWPEHMFPSSQLLTNTHSLYGDHSMRYGRLQPGSSGALSPVLTPSSALPQSLIDKMMVIAGLDIAFYIGHHTGGALGNFERRDQGDNASLYVPTIDQVLAEWSGFYGAGDPYLLKSMHVGRRMSWAERSSGIQEVDPATSPDVLFRTVLSTAQPYEPTGNPSQPPGSPSDPVTPGSTRTHVLNRVVEHYKNLTTGAFGDARRLSENDKARLTDHMDMVSDLARRFDTADVVAAKEEGYAPACDPQSGNSGNTMDRGDLYGPSPYTDLKTWHQDYNAVVAAAIACGSSRIATIRAENTFHSSSSLWIDHEQWHGPIAHRAAWPRARWANEGDLPEHPQDSLVYAKNNFYRDVYVDLVTRLDNVDTGDGTSLLDKGLVMWTQENGMYTHHSYSLPVVTAGSVDGYFNTGHYFDLRNHAGPTRKGDDDNPAVTDEHHVGILYNQWLSNILQSMGMAPSQFQRSHPEGWAGYGHARIDRDNFHPSRLLSDVNNKIPKVTSGT